MRWAIDDKGGGGEQGTGNPSQVYFIIFYYLGLMAYGIAAHPHSTLISSERERGRECTQIIYV